MKKLTLSLIIFSVLVSITITAKAEVTILGDRSCGTWINDRKENGVGMLYQSNWLMGYLAGMSVELNKDLLRNTDMDSLNFWVDNFCKNNPLDTLTIAGRKLEIELIKREHH